MNQFNLIFELNQNLILLGLTDWTQAEEVVKGLYFCS